MATVLEPSVVNPLGTDEGTALLKENYLGEFETDEEKSVARSNLGVYAKEAVYTIEEAQQMMEMTAQGALSGYVTKAELPEAIDALGTEIAEAGYVRSDGTVPFTAAQQHPTAPTEGAHVANKTYVDNVMNAHLSAYDPHGVVEKVEEELAGYAKLSDVYTTGSTYTKKETESLLSEYVKRDGSVSFTAPVIGVDPELPAHLANRRYVNSVMDAHKKELDPHGLVTALNEALQSYYTTSQVYTKAQTFSRKELTGIIQSQMESVVKQALATWEANEGSVSDLREWVESQLKSLIHADGSVAFGGPQVGVAAETDSQLTTLAQVNGIIDECCSKVEERLTKVEGNNVWVTSGPVLTTVGYVEDNTTLPAEMTLQQVCDAIFYGKTTGVCAPEYAEYGERVCITIHTHGVGTLSEVDIYANGVLIGTLYPEDFEQTSDRGCDYEYCASDPITGDVEWEVVFHYSDGGTVTDTAKTTLAYPVFVGVVPYWWNAQEDITMSSLRKLAEEDPGNCSFLTDLGPDFTKVTLNLSFEDPSGRSLVAVVPYEYSDLTGAVTAAQDVGAGAFAKWVQPMTPNSDGGSVMYKIYVFNQTLYRFDGAVTLSFETAGDDEKD